MPWACRIPLYVCYYVQIIKQYITNLQTYRHKKSKKDQTSIFIYKKTSPDWPGRLIRRYCATGSLSVEAAFVLPLFLFAMISLSYLGEALGLYSRIQASLQQTARELAEYAYAYDAAVEPDKADMGSLGLSALGPPYVRLKTVGYLGNRYLEIAPIKDGIKGIHFTGSQFSTDGNIDIIADYQVRTPYAFLGIDSYRVIQRCRVHAWIGYTGNGSDQEDTGEEMVYITKSGTVYHRDRNCTHIELSIHLEALHTVSGLRNESGGKYYPCEHCGEKAGTQVYITDTGDRYHSGISCSGLKREIIMVPLSRVGARPPCSRCG